MGWVNERLQGADNSQNFRPKFLALRGSSFYIFGAPPVRMPGHLVGEGARCQSYPYEPGSRQIGPGRRQRQMGSHGLLQTSVVRTGPTQGLTTSNLLPTHKGNPSLSFCSNSCSIFSALNISWCGGGMQTVIMAEDSKMQSKQNAALLFRFF